MKKYFILTVLTTIFMNLPISKAHEFSDKSIKQVHGKKFEIYPVKVSKTTDKRNNHSCLEYGKECLLPLTKRPALVFEDFQYQKMLGEKAGIKFSLSEKQARDLEKFSKKYLNSRMAFVYNNRVLQAPKIKNIINGSNFEITFNNKNNFNVLLSTLENSK